MGAWFGLKSLLRDCADVPSVLDVWLYGLNSDSRSVRPGDAFIALRGGEGDAWRHVPEAIENGAVAVLLESEAAERCFEHDGVLVVPVPDLAVHQAILADRFYGMPSQSLAVIGVTGTNGKSSVTAFLSQMLEQAGIPTAVIGTLGYGFAGRVEPASHTTPDVVRLHRLLADYRDRGAGAVVMEVSSHGLSQGRVRRVSFRGALYTNLTQEHLDYHGSMEEYAGAKELLFTEYYPDFAVINLDDAFGVRLLDKLDDSVELLRYSVSGKECELYVLDYQADHDGLVARVMTPVGELKLHTGLLGRFNLENLLAALGGAVALGSTAEQLEAVAPKLLPPPGRLEQWLAKDGRRVVIDYAHTADALETVLQALRPHVKGQLWCVFGCGGNRDRGKRPVMGAVAERLSDAVVVTDDNPRDEDPETIVEEILAGMDEPERVCVEHDRRKAIEKALASVSPDDLVLVAGKGHETTQERRGEKIPCSDVEMVKDLLDGGGAS